MQSAEMTLCENPSDTLNCAWNRRVLVQRQMRPDLVVISHVRRQHLPKVTLAKDNDMVEHFPPDTANQPFSACVLPWRSRCSWSVTNAHRTKPPDICFAINASTIANDVLRHSVPATRLGQLSSNPFSCRVCHYPQPHDLMSTVPQNQKAIQQPERKRRHDEQVDRSDAVRVIAEKGPSAL